LYKKYTLTRHGRDDEDRSAFEDFLFSSPIRTVEFNYRKGDRLVAVGICDVCDRSLSSVYFYFDPDESRRGLGVFGTLKEVEYAAGLGIEYYYLGYWIEQCTSMNYKSRFRPCQVLYPDGQWLSPPDAIEEDSQ
jgi:arginine-tRNA-protein transferase